MQAFKNGEYDMDADEASFIRLRALTRAGDMDRAAKVISNMGFIGIQKKHRQ
jgi:hypothetical protein